MMVAIFKTNVTDAERSEYLAAILHAHFPLFRVTFHLDDCDKILRIAGEDVCYRKVTELMNLHGCNCSVLE